VDKVFAEVFGYSSIVDPAITMGKCVRKSNSNAAHDGQIIDCPIKINEEGSVYQLLIDNQIDDDHVMDIRVPVYRDVISEYLSIWIKPKEARFLVNFGERRCAHPSEILSQEEQQNILCFCRKLGLEFGELDVLRHRPEGKIYIVDANPTPDGGEIPIEQEREDFKFDALLFETIFIDS
jgi:hypothetical protein